MADNPFEQKPPHKKIIVSASLTRAQKEAFDELMRDRKVETPSGLIKDLLRNAYQDMVSKRGELGYD